MCSAANSGKFISSCKNNRRVASQEEAASVFTAERFSCTPKFNLKLHFSIVRIILCNKHLIIFNISLSFSTKE